MINPTLYRAVALSFQMVGEIVVEKLTYNTKQSINSSLLIEK